jgi:NADPH:quinone reductase-like Zn-dependent oxidoreductase
LAKWRGAYVIGTASARHHDFLRGLGVDELVDYTTTRFEDAVHDVDMVLDPMSGETRARSWQVLRKGGILVSILSGIDPALAAAYGVRSGYLLVRPDQAQLTEIARLVDAGYLHPEIDAVFPLADAVAAHARGEQGRTRGKIVLQVV